MEDETYKEELAIAEAFQLTFQQRKEMYAPNILYGKMIGLAPNHAVRFPPIPKCTDCHFLIPFTVSKVKPNCPWCWEWIYFGAGSLFHIYRHLS